MYKFKVNKTSNDIEDICVANGICSILEYNDIDFNLKDNKSVYTITTEEFDLEDIIFFEIEHKWNINSSSNVSQFNSKAKQINEYMNDNMVNILNYFLGLEPNDEKVKAIGIGNNFYTLSIRASTTKKTLDIKLIESYISIVGWLASCSYIKNDSIESTILLKPKNTDDVKKPYNMTYTDKESGEVKVLTSAKSGGKYISSVVMEAIMYTETLLKYNLISEEYCGIYFMRNTLAGNKPLANTTNYVETFYFSLDFLNEIKKKLTYSSVAIDCKDVTAKYMLDIKRYNTFSNLIKLYSKNNEKLNIKYLEEMLNMYDDTVKNIYFNESVIKLGNGLNRLLRDNEGFEGQVKLYSVLNIKHLANAIRVILTKYNKKYGYSLLTDEQLKDILELVDNKEKARICSDAILSYAVVYINIKKEGK